MDFDFRQSITNTHTRTDQGADVPLLCVIVRLSAVQRKHQFVRGGWGHETRIDSILLYRYNIYTFG